jgi:hypothetical protein
VVRFLKDPLELADVKRTWSFAFVSAIMLFVPEQHYRNFAGLFLNQPAMLSIYRAWEQLLVKHQADSQNFTVLVRVGHLPSRGQSADHARRPQCSVSIE